MIKFFVFLSLTWFACISIYATDEQPIQPKEWTFLVFLNGDNNLDDYGTEDMAEMKMVGGSDNVNLVVLRDTSDSNVSSKIYFIEKDNETLIKDYGKNIDMGDWNNLVEFFAFAKEKYPAKKYLLDIWNHGAGWKKRMIVDPLLKGISYDDSSGNHITTKQLGMAMQKIKELNANKNIDILGTDACLMEMAEVIYEVKNSVDFVVGSEETEPGQGWPYAEILAPLVAKAEMDAADFSKILAKAYVDSYSDGSQGNQDVQYSSVSTLNLTGALPKLNELFDFMNANMAKYKSIYTQAINAVQEYYYSDYKDLQHFIMILKDKIQTDAVFTKLATEALSVLGTAVIANYFNGSYLENSYGVSIWIPNKSTYNSKKELYKELNWTVDTKWGLFLENYYRVVEDDEDYF